MGTFEDIGNFAKRTFGRISGPIVRSTSPKAVLGESGVAIFDGLIQSVEKDSSVAGKNRYKTYSEALVNFAIVGAGVRFYLNLVSGAKWSVEPSDKDNPQAVELAEFVQSVMDDMETPWSRVVRRTAMFKFYGFSIQEWIAKSRDDGQLGFLDISPRAQVTIERWNTDRSGSVLDVIQRSPQTQEELTIPRGKIVYAVDDSLSDSPEGLGIFRHIAPLVERLKEYLRLEAVAFQTDLRGVPFGRAPLTRLAKMIQQGTITKEQAQQIKKPMEDFVKNHIRTRSQGVILDSEVLRGLDADNKPSTQKEWDISLLTGDGRGQADLSKAINRLNHEIARLIGVENILLGSDGRGTQALSRDKSHNLFLIIDSALTEIRETYDGDIIGTLWALNGFPEELRPKFSTEAIEFREIEQITGALRDMAAAGAVLEVDDPAINEVRDLLGLSKVEMNNILRDLESDALGTSRRDENDDEDTILDRSEETD